MKRSMESSLCLRAAMLAFASILSATCVSAQPAGQAVLEAGRTLTSQLKLDAKADAQLFDALGFERSAALFQAVLDHGQQPSATPQDWKNLHRAVEGLAELALWHGDTYRAALYYFLQNNFYANLEGDYSKALEAARRSLSLQEQTSVTATLYLVRSAVGRDLAALGQRDEALAELLTAHQADPDPASAQAALRWRDLIQAEIALGRQDDAQRELSELEQRVERAGGLSRARALLARADVELAGGAVDGAVDAVVKAQGLVTDTAEKQEFGIEAVYELMVCVLDLLDRAPYPEAIRLGNRIAAEITGLPVNIAAFARQAVLARQRIAGDLDGVLRDYSEDLAEAKRTGNRQAEIESLRAIGATYAALHARAQRVAVLEEALGIETTLLPADGIPATYPATYSFVTTLNSLGDAYNEMEDERGAARFSRSLKVITTITSAGDRKRLESLASEARIGLARATEIDQDPDSARDLLGDETKRHPDSPWAALAWARLERNMRENPVKTSELYGSAASLFHDRNLYQNEIIVRLEYARYLCGDGAIKLPDALATAHAQVDTAAVRIGELRDAEAGWQLAYTSGTIAEAEGQRAEAIVQYREAAAKLDGLRSGIADAGRRQAFADSKLEQDLYSRLVALFAAKQSASDAWKYLEQQKARAFVEMLDGHQVVPPAGSGPEWEAVRSIKEQVVNLRANLTGSAADAQRGAGRSPVLLEARLRTLEAQYSVARERALIAKPSAAAYTDTAATDLDKVRRLLPAGSALLEFGLLPGKLAAFVATRNHVQLRTWPADAGLLSREVLRLRRALQTPDSDSELEQATADLSRLVIAPVASDIPANVDRLIVVPAAQLHQVPFQALRMPAGEYLADRFAISYIPAASALTALQKQDKRHGSLLLAAIGNVSAEGMPPLPGTLRETESIAAMEPGSKIITESGFTHDAALKALENFDEVHFATHGILDSDAPLFSALLTSPAQGQPSRFSLLELLDRKIRSRLVVLSACETGLGKMSAGDEITGLTRTFLTAGAKEVVSSLWKISDDSTALLMQEFYRGLNAGQSPAYAMRTAELKVRAQYPQPFYWAAFVVTGAI